MVVAGDAGDIIDVIGNILDAHDRARIGGDPGFHRLGHRGGVGTIEGLEARLFGRLFAVPFPLRGAEEARHPGHHHHAAIGRHHAKHVVGDVARMRVYARRAGVGEDDRCLGRGNRIAHGRRGDVAQIHQHAEAVHLLHYLDPERRQTVVFGLVGAGVGPFGGLVVGQRHVARAQIVKSTQRRHGAADLPPALNPQHRADPPRLVGRLHLVGAAGEAQGAGVGGDDAMGGVDLLDRGANGFVAHRRAADIDRPELPADAACAKPRHIGHQRRLPAVGPTLEALDLVAEVAAQRPGKVIMPVDQRGALEDAVDPLADPGVDLGRGCRGLGHGGHRKQARGGEQDELGMHGRDFTKRRGACKR